MTLLVLAMPLYNNVGHVSVRNDSMAPTTIEVGAGETAFTLQPNEKRPIFFWLYHNHERFFSTSVSYPNGYHYNRHFSLRIGPGYSELLPVGDAPAPQLFLQNQSSGRPYFRVVEIPSGIVTNDSVANANRSGLATEYVTDSVVQLEYHEAYAVVAEATYSATESYVARGTFTAEPGFSYKMLTCGELGKYGRNCGPFQIKNQDGGWYNSLGEPAAP